jgi:hypothetical protein
MNIIIVKKLTELNSLLRIGAEISENNIAYSGFEKRRSSSVAKDKCTHKYRTKLAKVFLHAVKLCVKLREAQKVPEDYMNLA